MATVKFALTDKKLSSDSRKAVFAFVEEQTGKLTQEQLGDVFDQLKCGVWDINLLGEFQGDDFALALLEYFQIAKPHIYGLKYW